MPFGISKNRWQFIFVLLHLLWGYLQHANRIRRDEGPGPLLEAAKITDLYIKTFNDPKAKQILGSNAEENLSKAEPEHWPAVQKIGLRVLSYSSVCGLSSWGSNRLSKLRWQRALQSLGIRSVLKPCQRLWTLRVKAVPAAHRYPRRCTTYWFSHGQSVWYWCMFRWHALLACLTWQTARVLRCKDAVVSKFYHARYCPHYPVSPYVYVYMYTCICICICICMCIYILLCIHICAYKDI